RISSLVPVLGGEHRPAQRGPGRTGVQPHTGRQLGADLRHAVEWDRGERAMPRPWHAGCTKISGTPPALSAAARPTGPVPVSATRPSASIAIPAGSSGHDGGSAVGGGGVCLVTQCGAGPGAGPPLAPAAD